MKMFILIRVCSLMDILAYYVVQEHLVVRWADLVDTWVAREVWMLATRGTRDTSTWCLWKGRIKGPADNQT